MQKVSSVELLRFISSLMVLIWHYQLFYLPYNSFASSEIFYNDRTIQPFYEYLSLLFNYGNFGVDFFFLISGYVFAYVYLLDKKMTSGKEFFLNRFARLYPLHFLTLLFVLLVQLYSQNFLNTFLINANNDFYHFILHLFFISGWGFERGPSFNGPIWSVSVEIIIYFFFFFLFIKLKKNILIKSTIIVFSLVLIRKIINLDFFEKELKFNIYILNCGILFFMGVIIHFLNKKIISRKIFLILGSIFFVLSIAGNFKLFIFLPSILITFLCFENFINKHLRNLFNFLGNLTYGMYLWHFPVQITLIALMKSNNLDFELINTKFFFILYLSLVFSVSTLSYFYFENIFRKKLKFKY
jgi:peptidoglycan/LPS O-acetylase OafA/YrhL|tara:strand:- start:684 stop:1748 length:1065 start_codon:yes stop_codon:yes gene_type:complete